MTNAEDLLTDEARSWIGLEIDMKSDPITPRDVREYVTASDDYNPLYTDEEVARAAGYPTTVVPPLNYMHLVRQRIPLSDLTRDGGTPDRRPPIGLGQAMAAGQEFEFLTPLYVGDSLVGKRRLAALTPKNGATKAFILCTWETDYYNQHGELVIRERNEQILY